MRLFLFGSPRQSLGARQGPERSLSHRHRLRHSPDRRNTTSHAESRADAWSDDCGTAVRRREPESDDAFFATGLTDEVISDLSKVKALRVISRNSSMKLKGTNKDLRTLGRELNVRYALTGSIRRTGDALRITAELVDTATDTPIWGDKYAGTVVDVFDLQEKLARQIVDALRVTVTPEESRRLAMRAVEDVGVYEKIVKARELLYSYSPSALDQIKDCSTRLSRNPETTQPCSDGLARYMPGHSCSAQQPAKQHLLSQMDTRRRGSPWGATPPSPTGPRAR